MRGRGGGGRGNEREDQLYQVETREGAPLEEEEAMILRGCLYWTWLEGEVWAVGWQTKLLLTAGSA